MRRWVLLAACAGGPLLLAGCWSLPVLEWNGGMLPTWEPQTDPDIARSSVTRLAGDGALYLDTPKGTAARSWLAHLKQLGLPARLDDGECIQSETPDGHRFTITVFTVTEEPGVEGAHTRAYLTWRERAYSTRGWQVLTDLERERR
jgi:hypothetical protein